MKSFLWFVLGLAGGFVAAHLVNKDPRGHEALAEVDARITEFTDGIAADVKDAAASALDAAKGAAANTVEAAKDAASTAADAAKGAAATLTD